MLCGLCANLYAADWHVPTNSLEAAITSASNNDNIIIDSNIISNLTLTPTPYVIDKVLNYSSNIPGLYSVGMYVSTVANSNRHFSFTSGASGSTFTNLALNNTQNVAVANSISKGGAIYTEGADLSFTGVTFGGNQGNRASAAGGAIYSLGGNLIINDASGFTSSTAQSTTSTGGAVYIEDATLVTNDTVIFNTNKAAFGGGIYSKNSSLTLSNTTSFTSNQATGGVNYGGAIYLDGGTLVLSGSNFASNTATGGAGGAIYNNLGVLTVGASVFNLNTSLNGAAIYNTGTLNSVGLATFTTNTASGSGGAVYNTGSNLVFTGTIFTGNKSTGANLGGGAIYNSGWDLTINDGTSFTSNTASSSGGKGGAVYSENGNVTIGAAVFTLNTASQGAALYVLNGNINIAGTVSFMSNTASAAGGAIFIQGVDVSANISGIDSNNAALFQNNISSGSFDANRKIGAGAIFFDGINAVTDISFDGTFNPNDCLLCINYATFDSNKASSGLAGAIYINNTVATISNSVFSNNSTISSNSMGGAIYNGPGAKTYIENTSFLNNFTTAASAYGGAIANSGYMKMVNVTISGNSSKTWGGAVLNSGNFVLGEAEFYPEMTIVDSYFYQNSSTSGGGGLCIGDNAIKTDVINTKFVENVGLHGGALYNETVATIIGSEFKDNMTLVGGQGGGAIWSGADWAIGEKLDISVDDTEFTGNKSNTAGGAVYLNISSSTTVDLDYPNWEYPSVNTFKVTNSTFTNNQTIVSGHGGAIYGSVTKGGDLIQDRKLILDVDNVVFDSNSAGGSGGAVYVTATYVDTANSKIGSTEVTIENSDFENNTAGVSGGAIYNSVTAAGTIANMTLMDVDFDNNSAGTSGGGLYLSGQSATTMLNVVLSNVSFTGNQVKRVATTGTSYALTGGAINNNQYVNLEFQNNHNFDSNGIDGSLTNIGTGAANFALTMNSYGGALYTASNSVINLGTFVFNFTDNYTKVIVNTTNSGTFNSTATANSAGGAFYDSTIGTIEFNAGTVFDGNNVRAEANSINTGTGAATATATAYGGAIYNSGNGIINIYNSSLFIDNSVTSVATAVGLGTETITMNAYGGAIYNTGTNSEINIIGLEKIGVDETHVVFRGNSATGGDTTTFGGAIYNAGKLNVSYALFENNTSSGSGGAIYSTNVFNLNYAEFKGNSSNIMGGAVYINATTGIFNLLTSILFDNNSSLDGGALYTKTTTNISNTVLFKNNSATQYGGAWYVSSGTTTIDGAVFDNNSAENGGAVYNNGTMNINGGTSFINNSSTSFGGAIYTMQNLTLNSTNSDITFNNNKVNGIGNDIYIGGTIARAIIINGTANNVIMNGGFATNGASSSGNYTITKSGLGSLLITADNFGFTGTSTISAGQVIVNGKWINGLTTVSGTSANNTLLRVTSDSVHEKVTISNTGTFEHLSTSLISSEINNANFKFTVVTGGTMKFMADSSLVGQLAKYNLLNNLANTANGYNTVLFKDSDVTFGTNSYQKISNGWINYTFQNSVINLSNMLSETTTFTQVTLDNATLSFDAGFKADGTLESDKLAITTLLGDNTIKLGSVYIKDGQNDTGLNKTYTSQVLMPAGLNFDSSLTTTVKSDIYEYQAVVSGKNITLTVIGAANENSLYSANAKLGTRAFNMTYFGTSPYTYNIGQSLSTTNTGTFNVVGNSAATSIISGILVDSTGVVIGSSGSFFDISGAVNFTLSNVSVVDAYKNGNGSVLFVTGTGATINLSNLILARNEVDTYGGAVYNEKTISFTGSNQLNENSAGSGGAIYNLNGGVINLTSTSFDQNIATFNGGAIYNAGTISFSSSSQFTSNTALNGGAVYNTGNITILGGSSFTNNTVTNNGGAVWNSGTVVLNSSLGNIQFSGNTATGNGNDIYNDGGNININGTANDVIIGGGISGYGNINKSGNGRLLINANSSGYIGVFTQTAGTTIFSSNMFNGTNNITAGVLELANGGVFSANTVVALSNTGIFNITTNSNITLNSGNLIGYNGTYGVANKSGTGDLTVSGDNSLFQGTFNQTSGRTFVDETSLMFNGINNISNSLLQITSSNVYEKVNIGNNGQLIHISKTETVSNINNTNIKFTGTGGNIFFNSDASLLNGTNYNLVNKIENGNLNTITFNDSNVFLGSNDYTGSTVYKFDNSVIDLNSGTITNVVFSNTNLNNTKLSFDVKFDMSGSNPILLSDTFNAGSLLGDTDIGIGIIRILNDDEDTGLSGIYTSQVLTNTSSLVFSGLSDTMFLSTNAYEYEVTTNNKNVVLSVIGASDMNSLYRMNDTVNKRGFNISYFSGSTVYYNIGQSLGTTKNGEFIVQGFDSDPDHGVISGKIVDVNNDPTGEYGSFFKLTGSTIFTLKNLTIEEAYSLNNGSVLYMTNASSTALLEKIIIQDNEVVENGGAVYVSAGLLSINNASFDSNISGMNGGAVWNSSNNSTINTTKFEDNEAVGNGGAVYNSGTITFVNLIEFISNKAVNGSALYNSGSVDFQGEVDLYSNIASGNGAIYNSGTAVFRGITTISGNEAVSGGAVYLNTGTVTFNGVSDITSNEATTGNGGAVYVASGTTLNINNNMTASSNTANSGFGGAIYLAGSLNLGGASSTTISFSGNSDSSGDNDIYMVNSALSINGLGTYSFNSGISGDTGSSISLSGSGARFNAEMTGFNGSYTQSGISSIAQIYGTLNANYTITNGTTKFKENALSSGKTITVNGNGIAQYEGLNSNNLGTVIGTGTLVVLNTLTNTGTLDVATLQINSDLVNNGVIDSDNTTINADVTNNATISGIGTTTVTSGASLLNLGTISQNKLIINSSGVVETDADDIIIVNNISNNGTLIFNSGDNSNIISGTGIVSITGIVGNTALISTNNLEIVSGAEFSSDISKLAIINPIENEGVLNLSGNGSWTKSVVGNDGIITFASGTINNTAVIQQKGFIVKSDGQLSTDGSLIQTNTDGVLVNGILNVVKGNLTTQDLNLSKSLASDVPVFDLRSSSSVDGASIVSVNSINADAGSKIFMDIFSDGTSDVINVSGNALMNGELHVRAGVGTYRNLTFTIMNANNLSGDLIDDITSGNIPTLAFIDASNITDARYDYKYDADSNTITLFFNGINMSNFANISGLTFNQTEVAKAMDKVSETTVGDMATIINEMIDINDEQVVKDVLSELSPYFLANILRPTPNIANRAHLYGRMKDYCDNCYGGGLWIDGGINNTNLKGDENSIGKLNSVKTGVTFGYDYYLAEKRILLGVFGNVTPETIDQGNHSADVQNMGAGVYFGLLKEDWDAKSVVSFGLNNYSTSRKIYNQALNLNRMAVADFGGYNADFDLEFGYKFKVAKTFKLRPYAGAEIQMLSYDGFEETGADSLNMNVSSGSNLGTSARIGVGLEQKLSKTSWYVSGEYNTILTGKYIDLETKFANTDVRFSSRGADIGTGVMAFNAGIDYDIDKRFNVYASANYQMGGGFDVYGIKAGFRFKFCSDKRVSATQKSASNQRDSNQDLYSNQDIYLDKEVSLNQRTALEVSSAQNVPETPTEYRRVGETYYEFDKYTLNKSTKEKIKIIANNYKDTATKFVIKGHTDSIGTEKYNLSLSEKRANAVAEYMIESGVNSKKIEYLGLGSYDPEYSNSSYYGRAKNRRVDIMMFNKMKKTKLKLYF